MFYLSTFIFEFSTVITEYDDAGIKWLQIKCVQNENSKCSQRPLWALPGIFEYLITGM